MTPISLKVVSSEGIEASITCDGSQGGQEDYFSVVSVKGFMENKKIFGTDPIQSFTLGWKLIEQLTLDKRIGGEGSERPEGASWRIESLSPE